MSEIITIVVEGKPEPGGSKKALPIPNPRYKPTMHKVFRFLHNMDTGMPIINVADANDRAKPWKKKVAQAASEQYSGALLDQPLLVEMTFYVTRPQLHMGTGRNAGLVKNSAPLYPGTRPDALKLARPVEDALTGIVWTDDGRTCDLVSRKRFADAEHPEGVVIRVLPHAHETIGAAAEAAQQELAVGA
jgi:Holliday junction resolvase RusA-like endonuclease